MELQRRTNVNFSVNNEMAPVNGQRSIGRGRGRLLQTVPLNTAGTTESVTEVIPPWRLGYASRPKEDTNLETKKVERKFWVESKRLEVLPVPHESNVVLEEPDVEFGANQFFGHNETLEAVKNETFKVVFPRRILKGVDGRPYVINLGYIGLPIGHLLDTRLLFVDSKDILYFRFIQPDQKPGDHKIATLSKLLSCLKEFYSVFSNQVNYCVGSNDWVPRIGEVVVVKVQKLLGTELSPTGYFTRNEYHRAVVIAIKPASLTVELIDDYGIGGVRFVDVFRILEKYIHFPVQMFVCELAEMGIVNFRKMIRTILRNCPIPNIWPDCNMNYVGITWRGEFSQDKRPLVEVLIRLKSSSSPASKYISLKNHVYQNLQNVLTPFVHLVEKPTAQCYILGATKTGILSVKFVDDEELLARISYILDRLVPYYFMLLKYLNLTVEMILPKDEPRRFKRNKAKIYAALLPGKDAAKKTLYRVKITKADCNTNLVKVYAIDHHTYHDVYSWDLVPMYNLYPDLSYIAPLVFRVHLHSIKELNIGNEKVKELLFGQEIKMKLIREWSDPIFPPDVAIDSVASVNEDFETETGDPTFGYASAFISKGWATTLSDKDTEALDSLIKMDAKRRAEEEKMEEINFLFDDKKAKRRMEMLLSHTFMGENYRFSWDNHCFRPTNCASATSASSVHKRDSEYGQPVDETI